MQTRINFVKKSAAVKFILIIIGTIFPFYWEGVLIIRQNQDANIIPTNLSSTHLQTDLQMLTETFWNTVCSLRK